MLQGLRFTQVGQWDGLFGRNWVGWETVAAIRTARFSLLTTLIPLGLAARGHNPPGIRAEMHPGWTAPLTYPRCKANFTLCHVWYTFSVPKAALCVAPRPKSAAIGPSSRLASPAPRRSRCSRGFIRGLLAAQDSRRVWEPKGQTEADPAPGSRVATPARPASVRGSDRGLLDPGLATLTGVVRDSASLEPIAFAQVRVSPAEAAGRAGDPFSVSRDAFVADLAMIRAVPTVLETDVPRVLAISPSASALSDFAGVANTFAPFSELSHEGAWWEAWVSVAPSYQSLASLRNEESIRASFVAYDLLGPVKRAPVRRNTTSSAGWEGPGAPGVCGWTDTRGR